MTGFKSKRAAALDEEGMYLVHHTAQPAQEPWPEEPFGHMAGGVQPAQPAQEPVAWMGYEGGYKIFTRQRQIADAYPKLYTVALYPHPHPQRPWVDLTNEDLAFLFPHGKSVWVQEMVTIIQAKLKGKNNG